MAILKCKMCGGDLRLLEGKTTAECEYCGSFQTVPVVDDEKKLTLFNRANRLRFACEFDKAAGVYESIVAEFPEEAEAYWCLLLCKFGIEYVDDPKTGKKIPTCHRSSFESVLDDSDFELVMEYSDVVSRAVYRAEAKAIEELRKSIIEVSSKEEPYDIFICYKETDEKGNRTLDSVIAQDVYTALTEKGYRVFFSRISLEDKLGVEYEPFIFAALNSAKIMLAFGTDYEYYNAVWVKNEWSRFLQLIAAGQKKTLIPCYKNIDAYDLPKEFAKLQAQDMGKVGAMQDLLRGIEKILPKKSKVEQKTVVVQQSAAVGVAAGLVKRGIVALGDGDWSEADAFFEQALNADAEYADAYLYKFFVSMHCPNAEAYVRQVLAETQQAEQEPVEACPEDVNRAKTAAVNFARPPILTEQDILALFAFDRSFASEERARKAQLEQNTDLEDRNLSRAIRFAEGQTKETIDAMLSTIHTEQQRRYEHAVAHTKAERNRIRKAYEHHLIESEQKVAELCRAAEEKLQERYEKALDLQNRAKTRKDYTLAKNAFLDCGNWKDSAARAKACAKQGGRQKQVDKQGKRSKKPLIILLAAALSLAVCFAAVQVLVPFVRYNQAIDLMEAQEYEAAIVAFEAMDGYEDSADRIAACEVAILDLQYDEALVLIDKENYSEAISVLKTLDGHRDSIEKITLCEKEIENGLAYDEAIDLKDAGSYIAAVAAFEELGDFRDAVEQIAECNAAFETAEEIRVERNIAALKTCKVGDYITFGAYEQDDYGTNGKEDLEWQVLEVKKDRVLVVSKYIIKKLSMGSVWRSSLIRDWLNGYFLNSSFATSEKSLIPTVTLSVYKESKRDPSESTEDKIFLLSIAEVKKYFMTDEDRQCAVTAHALRRRTGSKSGPWWLRSIGSVGRYDYFCSNVDLNGRINEYVGKSDSLGVRPAMWIEIGN